MIDSLPTVLLALAAAISSGQSGVEIESQALKAPVVLDALQQARKKGLPVQVVLGAKADYTLDANGQPIGGNRPYDSGPQGYELKVLDSIGASVFIPPQFSELDRPVFEPGVEMNAAFATVDTKWGVVCTAPLSKSAAGPCWTTGDIGLVMALRALHQSDRSDPLQPDTEPQIAKKLAQKDLILTPGNATDFYLLLRQPWKHVATSHLAEGKALDALLAAPPAKLWTSPDGVYSRGAIQKLRAAGWTIQQSAKPFGGVVLTSTKMAYLGSQKLDQFQIEKSRGLGIVLEPKHAAAIEQLLQLR